MSVRRQTESGYEFVGLDDLSRGERTYNQIVGIGLQLSVRACTRMSLHNHESSQTIACLWRVARADLQIEVGVETVFVLIEQLQVHPLGLRDPGEAKGDVVAAACRCAERSDGRLFRPRLVRFADALRRPEVDVNQLGCRKD